MKKKQIKHFIPEEFIFAPKCGYPACHCYRSNSLDTETCALPSEGTLTRKGVTCKNCRRTKVFRKLK